MGTVHDLHREAMDLPYLFEFTGSVIGVGFEPGMSEVRVRTVNHDTLRLAAPAALVEKALTLRHGLVRGMAVSGKGARLLRLEADDVKRFVLTDELAERYIFGRWNELLTRLAH